MGVVQSVPLPNEAAFEWHRQQLWTEIGAALPGVGTAMAFETTATNHNAATTGPHSQVEKFLQRGTLVGLLAVPHPILIRKYQANGGTTAWFRTYVWGVIYSRNVDPATQYGTEVGLFEIQCVSK